ncbi:MAG: S8 family peptidase [Salinarimonas sp.]
MAAPVQIILNQESFEELRDKGGGGPKKDFFANADTDFVRHKAEITTQLATVKDALDRRPTGNIGILKLVLRRSAWAKSHRPVRALFKPELTPVVGGGDLGEIFVEARPAALERIRAVVQSAEETAKRRPEPNTGKLVPYPSTARSETGAIDRIELYGAADRRRFSVEDGVEWLANPMTGGAYHIDLFDIPPPRGQWDAADKDRQLLYRSFVDGLEAIGSGLVAERLTTPRLDRPQLALRLERSTNAPALFLQAATADRRKTRDLAPFDGNRERHSRLLTFLDNHPLVRRIELPPILTRTILDERLSARASAAKVRQAPTTAIMPEPLVARAYPKMGVIDGGIASGLDSWIVHRWDTLANVDKSLDHGTFIAGLTVGGAGLNGPGICPEPDGIALVDIAIFPDEAKPVFQNYYPGGVPDFMDEIANAVADARARHGTRVFNLSLNVQHQAEPDQYGALAARLDTIAEQNDAIFVISAGNTTPQDRRTEWPGDETQALIALASARNDGLLMPAESIRSLSVAALNPPDLPTSLAHAPARYSRRGPGLRAGVKPDLAHIGGSGSPDDALGTGLFSVAPDGACIHGCGTSYAAPLVAKTAAMLDHSIEGDVSRETIIGLLMHHARVPELLTTKALSSVARDLVGFGMPPSAADILEGSDHAITLVFAHRLRRDQQVAFQFGWPPSLVMPNGKCRGQARLTLVSSPPLDTSFGAELVRVNIEAALQQEDFDKAGNSGWKGRMEAAYLPGRASGPPIEAERIEHGFKWSPSKMFTRTLRGVGKSSNWRMFVGYTTRAGEIMPDNGVPFTAILTISDPDGAAPVFNEMRALLARSGVRIEDIQTAARVATRV